MIHHSKKTLFVASLKHKLQTFFAFWMGLLMATRLMTSIYLKSSLKSCFSCLTCALTACVILCLLLIDYGTVNTIITNGAGPGLVYCNSLIVHVTHFPTTITPLMLLLLMRCHFRGTLHNWGFATQLTVPVFFHTGVNYLCRVIAAKKSSVPSFRQKRVPATDVNITGHKLVKTAV